MTQVVKTKESTHKRRIKQFSRYLATGLFSVVIEFSTLLMLVEVYYMNYLVANVIAFVITNICNYFISRSWVFTAGKHQPSVEVIIFFVTAAIGLGINQAVLASMVEYLSVDYRISKIFAVGLVVIWNFWARKRLVFKG